MEVVSRLIISLSLATQEERESRVNVGEYSMNL
jgi:hypothetical protein